jgi:hypothetical protein
MYFVPLKCTATFVNIRTYRTHTVTGRVERGPMYIGICYLETMDTLVSASAARKYGDKA